MLRFSWLTTILVLAACGATSPGTDSCAAYAHCGMLPQDTSEEQCIQDAPAMSSETALQCLDTCTATASCSELSTGICDEECLQED